MVCGLRAVVGSELGPWHAGMALATCMASLPWCEWAARAERGLRTESGTSSLHLAVCVQDAPNVSCLLVCPPYQGTSVVGVCDGVVIAELWRP